MKKSFEHVNSSKKLLIVSGSLLASLAIIVGLDHNNTKDVEPAAFVSTTGLVETNENVTIQDRLMVPGRETSHMPYLVSPDNDASTQFKSEFAEDPCGVALGKYVGEIACVVEDNSARLARLPGENS